MAQHDYVIANGTGAAVRSDLNNALAAIVTQNSGATAPATTYAYQWWADTTTGLLKIRNAANNAWITLRELDGTLTIEDGTASSPGLAFADDLNTGIYSPSADQLGITTGGTVRLTTTTTGITSALPVDVPLGTASAPTVTFTGDLNTGIYSPGADQVAISTSGAGRVFVDSTGRVGVNTSSPTTIASRVIHVSAGAGESSALRVTGNAGTGLDFIQSLNGDGFIYQRDNNPLIFGTNNVERLRITAAGLVGIGVTTPQYASHINATKNTTSLFITTDSVGSAQDYSQIGFGNKPSGNEIFAAIRHSYDNPGAGAAGALRFYTHTGSVLNERVAIDSSGRLLVGTSSGVSGTSVQIQGSSASSAGGAVLYMQRGQGAGSITTGDTLGRIYFASNTGGVYAGIEAQTDGAGAESPADYPGRLVFSTTRDGQSSPTQAFVIKENQDVLFTTSTSAANTTGWYGVQANTQVGAVSISRSGSNVMAFFHTSNANGIAGTPVGTISITTTATSYNTSSDYRLKENVEPVTDGITRLQQLKPSRFNFIADPDKTVDGFLAHEVQAVVPESITGEKDAVDEDGNPVYQGIDQSKLVPLLTAALQEAIAKIETLEARLTAAGIA